MNLDQAAAQYEYKKEQDGLSGSVASESPEQAPRGFKIDFGFLKTQTGDGDIEVYINHTLNFNKSRGMARIIRGLTGFAGELNFAIVDIFLGVLELRKGKPA